MPQIFPTTDPTLAPTDQKILETGTSASPYGIVNQGQDQPSEFKFGLGLRMGSTAAQAGGFLSQQANDRATINQERDPHFNVYDQRTPQFLQEHPWADQWFDSHEPDSVPNADVFFNLAARKDQELAQDQEWSTAKVGSGLGGIGIDIGLTAGVGSLLRIGRAIPTIGETALELASMSTAERVGWSALKGAGSMVAINEAANALRYNPGATGLDRVKGDAIAAGLGTVLGGAAGKMMEMGQVKLIQRAQAEITRSIAESGAVNDWGSAISQSKDLLKDWIKDPPLDGRTFTSLKTPETLPLMGDLQAKYEDAGKSMTFLDHPAQGDFDHFGPDGTLEQFQGELKRLVPQAGKFAEAVGSAAPGSRMANSPSLLDRMLHRTYFTEARPTGEMVDAPITSAAPTSAEGLKLQLAGDSQRVKQGLYDSVRQYFKGGGDSFSAHTADGPVDIRRASDWEKLGPAIDYHRQLADLADRGGPDAPAPHPLVAENFQRFSDFYTKRFGELEGIGDLEGPEALKAAQSKLKELQASDQPDDSKIASLEQEIEGRQRTVDRAPFYAPRRWLTREVQNGQGELAAELERQFHANRETDFHTQEPIDPATRPLMPELIDRMARALSLSHEDAAQMMATAKTEGGLPPEAVQPYQEAVSKYAASASAAAVKSILEMDRVSGMQSLADSTSSPMARRVMTDLDETKVSKFLDNDAIHKMERYDGHAAGRIAAGQAVQRSPYLGEIRDAVKRLTGKDLDPAAPDHELIKLASKNSWIEMSKTLEALPDGPAKQNVLNLMEAAQRRSGAALPAKINELMGMPVSDSAGLDANLRRAQNIFLRLPGAAFLGANLVTHLPNLAGAMMASAPAEVLMRIPRVLMTLNDATPREIEWLASSLRDDGRTPLELSNLPTRVDRDAPEPTATGRTLKVLDKFTDWMVRKEISLSGTNLATNVLRHIYSRQLLQDFFQNMKGMAGAQDLIDSGVAQPEAIAQSFKDPETATRMARLGIGGKDARQILALIQEHGVDTETGAPLKDLSPEQFQGYQRHISPEFGDWSDADRVMRDKLAAAVNTEVNNLVVRPTLTSKPIINNTFLGRLFNQFWAYHLAWGNQTAIMAGASPARSQAAYYTTLMMMGALSDTIHNSLSGRRSISESAQMWASNPQGMAYQAAARAGVLGWGNRLLNFADATPYGPAHALGNTVSSQQAAQVLSPTGLILGPSGDYANRLVEGALLPLVNGKGYDDRARHVAWSAVPFHNLLGITAPYRAAQAFGINPPGASYIAPTRPVTSTPQP